MLPAATKPEQVSSINKLAARLNGKDGIIYAGVIHHECENIIELMYGFGFSAYELELMLCENAKKSLPIQASEYRI